MSSQYRPRLPAEIIDLIVEAVVYHHPKALASLASVAHAIRYTVNAARFRRLDLNLNSISAKTKLLADILSTESAVWPANERTVRHIDFLDLILGPCNSRGSSSSSLCNNTPGLFVATILGAIQHAHEHQTRELRNPTRGLHIRIFSLGDLTSIIGSTPSVRSLSALNVEVKVALQQLCTNAHVDALELRNLFDVPDELVLFSSAATLDISDVSFSSNFSGKTCRDLPFKNIRRLAVRNSPSFLHIVSGLQDGSLPALEKLEFNLARHIRLGDLDAWARLREKAMVLRIGIHEDAAIYPSALHGTPCSSLEHLHLSGFIYISGLSGLPDPSDNRKEVRKPALLNALLLLPSTLPSLVDIHFRCYVAYYVPHDLPSGAHFALDRVYARTHHPALEMQLKDAPLGARIRISLDIEFTHFTPCNTVEFDKCAIESEHERYLYAKFLALRGLETATLCIRVRIGSNSKCDSDP